MLDREGQVLHDAGAAEAEARRYVQDLSRERGARRPIQMAVKDTAGTLVCRLPIQGDSQP